MNIISQGKHKTERRPNLTWLQIPPRSEDVTEPNSSSSLLPPLSGAKVGRNGLPPGVLARHGLRSRASTDKLNLLTSPSPTGTLKGPPDSSLPHSGSSVQLYAKRTSSLPIRKNGESLVSPDSSQGHGQFVDVDPYCEVVYTFSISFYFDLFAALSFPTNLLITSQHVSTNTWPPNHALRIMSASLVILIVSIIYKICHQMAALVGFVCLPTWTASVMGLEVNADRPEW